MVLGHASGGLCVSKWLAVGAEALHSSAAAVVRGNDAALPLCGRYMHQ